MQSCAVIGCGPAGMVASTMLRQSGLLVTCFEMSNDTGGMWATNGRDTHTPLNLVSPMHASLRCILPKDLMSYSDVRFDYTVPQFPHFSAVRRYLETYADRKGVRAITRFNTKVQSVRYDAKDGLWKLVSVNVRNSDVLEWGFDHVCVCTGQTNEARYPKGIRETLKPYLAEGGEVRHSSHVKNFRAWKGKRVVVVGDGATAYDYIRELHRNGAETIHSSLEGLYGGGGNAASTNPLAGAAHLHYMDGQQKNGSATAAAPLSMRGFMEAELRRLSPFRSRAEEDATVNDLLRRWIQQDVGSELLSIKHVGPLVGYGGEGRGLVFAESQTTGQRTSEIIKEARTIQLSKRGGPSGSTNRTSSGDADREQGADTSGRSSNSDSIGSKDPSDTLFLDNVDLVICATGFNVRFPFLHPSIREQVEEDYEPVKRIATPAGETSDKTAAEAEKEKKNEATPVRNSLYLGTLYAPMPTLSFVGIQRDLLPPFLIFEAQARFIAFAFSGRIDIAHLPQSELLEREKYLVEASPGLRNLKRTNGMGLHSVAYFNALQHELNVSSKETYASNMLRRQRSVMLSTLLRIIHKLRSMAPLKRKKQHLLFSNEI